MAVDGGDKEEKKEVKEQQVTVEAPELIGEPRVDELEQVDPFGHDGIFALLDEDVIPRAIPAAGESTRN